MNITRREMIQIGAGASAGLMLGCTVAQEIDQGLITKEIPSTGESIPVIGLGGRNYRLGEGWADNTDGYKATLGTFYELGGRVIDTSPQLWRFRNYHGKPAPRVGCQRRAVSGNEG